MDRVRQRTTTDARWKRVKLVLWGAMTLDVGRRARGAALAALFAGIAIAARADARRSGGAKADEDRRTALYDQGVSAATGGRWAEARERFAAALAIRPSPKLYFSIAQAEEQLGQLASASWDYGLAREGARAAHEGDVVSAAERALSALEPRVPRLRLVVDGATGATATLDGQPIALGRPVAVDPGTHRAVVIAPGMRETQAIVTLNERQQLELPVHLEIAAAEPAAPPPASTAPLVERPSAPLRTVGLVVAGVGLAGIGVGTYFGLRATSKNDESNRSGCTRDDCTPAAAAIRRDALTAADVSTGFFVGGGALLAGGIATWLLAPFDAGRAVRVTPMALGAGGGLAVSGGLW